MLLILTILIFVPTSLSSDHPPLAYSCQTRKSEKCRKLPFVPGHNILGEGVDIVTMKKTRASLLDLQKYFSPDKTCTVCQNPYKNMTLQKLPMAMVDWKPYSSCSRTVSSELSHSTFSLAENMASAVKNNWEAGLELIHTVANAKLVLAGSHSKTNDFIQGKTGSDRYSFVKQELNCVYYSFHLSHKPLLTGHFKHSLASLPKSYGQKTKANYHQLIKRYGTHYITQADVGGKALEITAIRTCKLAIDGVSSDEVKDCLKIESNAAVTGKMEAGAKIDACKELSQKATNGNTFHQTFNEKTWQVTGGKVTFDLLSLDVKNGGAAAVAFEEWMESLKTDPDIVTYSLEPIHNLVYFEGPIKENLRKAVSEYIMENALRKNCTCPGGSHSSDGAKCTCFCPQSSSVSSSCCPTKKGLAKLEVTIKQAEGLWGDYTSKTDSYVKIIFGKQLVIAPTIWNNNNPIWNMRFDLNSVELHPHSLLKLEVWDEDNKYDDDLLGSCSKPLTSGNVSEICYLNHGSLSFNVIVKCMLHLTGPDCQNYAPSTD
ncbi:perforin-1 [Pelodytes ibericus]